MTYTTPTSDDDLDLMERLELDTASDQERNYYHTEQIGFEDQAGDELDLDTPLEL